jgi:UDP-glucose 4-epimerase
VRWVAGRPDVAVIGAKGFLGSHVVTALRELGVSVAGFSRDTPFADRGGRPAPALAGASVIYYFATSITPSIAGLHPDMVAADRDVFLMLLGALAECAGPRVVVLASSGGIVYDPQRTPPYAEDAPLAPVSAYGEAKLRLERDLAECGVAGLVPVIARISNVYGPGQRTGRGQGVVTQWMHALKAGQPLSIRGDPSTVRDYVYAGDVAEAMTAIYRAVLLPGGLPRTVNIGSGQPTSLTRLLTMVLSVTGTDAPVEYAAGHPFDQRNEWLDISLAARTLGWQPRTSLLTGLNATWAALPPDRTGQAAGQGRTGS